MIIKVIFFFIFNWVIILIIFCFYFFLLLFDEFLFEVSYVSKEGKRDGGGVVNSFSSSITGISKFECWVGARGLDISGEFCWIRLSSSGKSNELFEWSCSEGLESSILVGLYLTDGE